jgi:propanol-preferring alcohol dehydrogenase
MKAWQFEQVGHPLELVDLPDPTPAEGQVVIDVKAAGICHTDIAFMDGFVPGMPTHLPIVLGHEVAGVISEIGAGVSGFAIGDRVGIAPIGGLGGPGVGRDGGYAERTIGLVDELVTIPEHVSFAQAAAGTDAGSTSYHAVGVIGQVTKGTRVGVIGLGGLGQIGARVAVLLGGEVYTTDIRPELKEVSENLGAAGFFGSVSDFAPLNLDVIIDFAGVNTTGAAITAVKPGGRVVQVGAGAPDATIPVVSLVTRNIELLGTLGGHKADVEAVFDLLETGELDPVLSTVRFDEISSGLDVLRTGKVQGRSVAVTA